MKRRAAVFTSWGEAYADNPRRKSWKQKIKWIAPDGSSRDCVYSPATSELIGVYGKAFDEHVCVRVIGLVSAQVFEGLKELHPDIGYELEQIQRYIELQGCELAHPSPAEWKKLPRDDTTKEQGRAESVSSASLSAPAAQAFPFDVRTARLLLDSIQAQCLQLRSTDGLMSVVGLAPEEMVRKLLLPEGTAASFTTLAGERTLLLGKAQTPTPLTISSNGRVGIGGTYVVELNEWQGPLSLEPHKVGWELEPLEVCELIHRELVSWVLKIRSYDSSVLTS